MGMVSGGYSKTNLGLDTVKASGDSNLGWGWEWATSAAGRSSPVTSLSAKLVSPPMLMSDSPSRKPMTQEVWDQSDLKYWRRRKYLKNRRSKLVEQTEIPNFTLTRKTEKQTYSCLHICYNYKFPRLFSQIILQVNKRSIQTRSHKPQPDLNSSVILCILTHSSRKKVVMIMRKANAVELSFKIWWKRKQVNAPPQSKQENITAITF